MSAGKNLWLVLVVIACVSCGDDDKNGSDTNGDDPGAGFNPSVAQCADQYDNDGDGLTDLDDPGCENVLDDDEVQRQCSDGEDNDDDGLVDYPEDPGCGSLNDDDEQNDLPPPECADGVDNDRDGSTDEEDIGCSSVADMSETDPDTIPECADGVDNNEDGVVDFPNDPGCSARGDESEETPRSPPACGNGRDDDEDGLTDYPNDPGCSGVGDRDEEDKVVTPECFDQTDNDRDGLTDFGEDDGCSSASDASELGSCQTVYTPPRVYANEPIAIDTSRGIFHSEGSCGGVGSPELVVMYRVEEEMDSFSIDTFLDGTVIPTSIYIRRDLCLAPEAEIACEREFATTPRPGQKVTVKKPKLGDYFIFIDGVAGVGGAVTLEVTSVPLADCRNGKDDDEDGYLDYPADPGCTGPTDRDEADEATIPLCANGIDDDGDGVTDYPNDPGCYAASGTSEENQCGADVFVTEYFEGAASVSASTGANDASASLNPHFSCGATNGHPERVFLFRNRFKTRATFRTDFPDTEILTAVYVRPFNDCGTSSAGEPCATEGGTLAGRSRLVVEELQPGDYAVVVDTASGDPGRFRLAIETSRIQVECNDGIDNDEDGRIDDDDRGCSSTNDRSERDLSTAPACDNGMDDDGDGKIDYPVDPGCETRGANNEAGEDQDNLPACFNGVDDDGDGLADIPNDPGCTSRGDNDETDLAIPPQCSNGRDDDGDGLRDYPEDDGCDFAGDRTE